VPRSRGAVTRAGELVVLLRSRMALEHTGQAHFYRCSECGGTFDLKHNDHECETREDAIARADSAERALEAIRSFAKPAQGSARLSEAALVQIVRLVDEELGVS
jgi:hypothetical protein